MTELKPCPFCGGRARIIFLSEYRYKPYIAACLTAGCMAEISELATLEEAEEKWNRRVGGIEKEASPNGH